MARQLIVFDVSLCAKSPSDEIEARLYMVPGVRDVERFTGGSSQYGLKFYTVADPLKDEESARATANRIWEFFSKCIPGVKAFRVNFLLWLS